MEEKSCDMATRVGCKEKAVGRKESFSIWSKRNHTKGADDLPTTLTSVLSSHDDFSQWLAKCENQVGDDVIRFKLLDLQAIMDNRKSLEELYDEIEDYEKQNLVLSESFQRFCQMIPPCSERDEKKAMIRDTRSRLMRLRLRVLEQREVYRLAVPLLCHYSENSLKMKSWLDEGEERSQAYIDMHDNDIVLLQHADEIEALLQDILSQKSIYEACLTYGEMAMYTVIHPFEELKGDIDEIIRRWDSLCSKLEKCLKRLDVAKKIEEESQKNEAERIDRQIRREVHKCNCHKTFQIVRVSEGKYLFGSSKIVRLVRIHGSSVVVRVGGGWEFLYEFLMRCDPCRAKEFLEDGLDSLRRLGLKPIDERRHSYAFESRRVYSPVGHSLVRGPLHKENSLSSDVEHDCEVRSICSSVDSLDGGSLGSDAGHTCNEKTPKSTRSAGTKSLRRKTSNGSTLDKPLAENGTVPMTRPRTATPSSGRRPARRSLIERQGDYSEKGKSASTQRKVANSSNFA